MNDLDLFNRFALVTIVASGAITFGVSLLVFAPQKWWGRTVAGTATVGVMSGLTAILRPEVLGQVSGLSSGVALFGVLAGSTTVRKFVLQFVVPMCRPRVAGAAAVLAASGLWGYEAWNYDRGYEALMDETLSRSIESTPPETAAVASAITDRGTSIPMYSPTNPCSITDPTALEQHAPVTAMWNGRYIRRGVAGDDSNCHGWVFTEGRYNVLGRHVDTILTENGYEMVSSPAPGDVCIFRKGEQVTHTAVVRAVLHDGTVLVEGKWGRLGVYLHDVSDSCYGDEYSYYHTDRVGHLLAGLTTGGSTTGSKSDVTEATDE